MKNPETRKLESIHLLKQLDIPYIEHLPCIESENEMSLRSEEKILERMIAIIATFGKATNAAASDLEKYFTFHHPIQFTEKELNFMQSKTYDQKQSIQFSWKIECVWVLFWSLGLLDELNYPNDICDVDFILEKLVTKSKEEIRAEIKMRSKEEILDYTDFIYRIHWAARNALIKQQEMPGNMDYGVVFERHYALNWLTNYMDLQWDDISTDT